MRDRRNRLLSLLALTLLGAASLPAPASAGSGSIARMKVQVGDLCFRGQGEPRIRHTVTLRASDGTFRARGSARSGAAGGFAVCPFVGGLTLVNPGDKITVTTRAGSRTLRMPDLRPRIDRDSDVIWGRGPRGASVRVDVDGRTSTRAWTVPVDDRGYWRIDTTGRLDIHGRDHVDVRLRHGGDALSAEALAPHLVVGLNSNIVTGATGPGRQQTVTLSRGEVTHAAVSSVSLVGSLFAVLETPRGRAVYPRAGDVVRSSVGGGIRLRIPTFGLTGDAAEDTVRLRCMAHAPFSLIVYAEEGFPVDGALGRTDADGRATKDVDVRKGQTLAAACDYPGGDVLMVHATVE